MGLVKQVVSSMNRKNIQRLTKVLSSYWCRRDVPRHILLQTFLTLSLADMASRVHLSGSREAEEYVLHMVSL